jgi:deoxycytidylate deaminase
MAFEVAKRSTCDHHEGHHGCVVARDGLEIVIGYNGSVDGDPHCDEAGHDLIWATPYPEAYMPLEPLVHSCITMRGCDYEIHCVRTLHAEQNAIVNAAILGVSITDADWYVTGVPCPRCWKTIRRTRPRTVFLCGDRGAPLNSLGLQRPPTYKGPLCLGPNAWVSGDGVCVEAQSQEQLTEIGVMDGPGQSE